MSGWRPKCLKNLHNIDFLLLTNKILRDYLLIKLYFSLIDNQTFFNFICTILPIFSQKWVTPKVM